MQGKENSLPPVWRQLLALSAKDLKLELRRPYVAAAVLLYAIGGSFVVYLALRLGLAPLSDAAWNALLWVIVAFAALQAAARGFAELEGGAFYFYYSLASPQAVILSKMLVNSLITSLQAGATALCFGLLLGWPVEDPVSFGLLLVLAGPSLGFPLTLVGGIASRTGSAGILLPVMGLPLLVAVVLQLLDLSAASLLGPVGWEHTAWRYLLVIDGMALGLSYLLFPYLWRS